MPKAGTPLPDAVKALCLWFPESEEVPSRGSPDYRVRGRTFATFVVNHHGDSHVALWLRMPPGAQRYHCERDDQHYFVPPYVGPKGWLGVELNGTIDWQIVATRTMEAYRHVAPTPLVDALGDLPEFPEPTRPMAAAEIDPLLAPHNAQRVADLHTRCVALPEVERTTQFGNPVWKAGKKTFAGAGTNDRHRLYFTFWVGTEQQSLMTLDSRYRIPAYTGHNGWIVLDVHEQVDWREIDGLIDTSYRHFALKRMLAAMPDSDG